MSRSYRSLVIGFTLLLVFALASEKRIEAQSTAIRVEDNPTRPLIVFIHGRGQAGRGREAILKEWFSAFRKGLNKLDRGDLLVEGKDYVMVTYDHLYEIGSPEPCPDSIRYREALMADLLQRQSQANYQLASLRQQELEMGVQAAAAWERARDVRAGTGEATATLLGQAAELESKRESLTEQVQTVETELAQIEQDIAAVPTRVAELEMRQATEMRSKLGPRDYWAGFLTLITRLAAESQVASQVILNFFQDTEKYIVNPRYRCGTNATLQQILDSARQAQRPIVLVGHSMGTLVAFNLLYGLDSSQPNPNPYNRYPITRFISLGSQLGNKNAIGFMYGELAEAPEYPYPTSVSSWVNFRCERDYIAPDLVRAAYHTPRGRSFLEFLIPPSEDRGYPHHIANYLSNPAVSHAIAYAWCSAFPKRVTSEDQAAPPGCDVFTKDVGAGEGGAKTP